MLNEGASLEDPKGKSMYQSRDEKHQRELEVEGELAQRYASASRSTSDIDKPSKECKVALFQALYKFCLGIHHSRI
jgi:hypothetical protein